MKIIPRHEWRAASPNRTVHLTTPSSRTGFVAHHGVGTGGANPDEAKAILRGYQRLHQGNGWGDIGYNFAIDKWGNIYEARGFDAVGAHAGGHNTANLGVVLIGDSRNGDLTDAAKAAFQDLYAHLQQQTSSNLRQLVHSDLNATACPGEPLRQWVKGGNLSKGHGTVVTPPAPRTPAEPTYNGIRVREIQQLLTQRGFPTVVDGIYGPHTERQVRAFQAQQGIAVDGVVGPVTIGRLRDPRTPKPAARAVLRRGSRGSDVTYLQSKLGGLVPDGIFGPATEARVRAFQAGQGIAVDGIVGPATWARVEKPQPVRQRPTLRRGSRGADVTYLQQRLRAHGYQLDVDGQFGPITETRVRAFQAAQRIGVDGIVGPVTWSRLA